MASKIKKLDNPVSPPSEHPRPTSEVAPTEGAITSGKSSHTMRLSACPTKANVELQLHGDSTGIRSDIGEPLRRDLTDAKPKHGVTQQPRDPRSLFALPPEIRANIFSYVLISPHPLRVDKHGRATRTEWSICQTCRQNYSEAVPIFYAQNIFRFSIRRWEYVRRHWLKNIRKENLCLVKSVQLDHVFSVKWPRMHMLTGIKKVMIRSEQYDAQVHKSVGKDLFPDAKVNGWANENLGGDRRGQIVVILD